MSRRQLLLITRSCIQTFDWYRPRWPNSIALHADYVTVVEDRPTLTVKYCIPVPIFHFWPKPTHPAARFLCDSWASCTLFLFHLMRREARSRAKSAEFQRIQLKCYETHCSHCWVTITQTGRWSAKCEWRTVR